MEHVSGLERYNKLANEMFKSESFSSVPLARFLHKYISQDDDGSRRRMSKGDDDDDGSRRRRRKASWLNV